MVNNCLQIIKGWEVHYKVVLISNNRETGYKAHISTLLLCRNDE